MIIHYAYKQGATRVNIATDIGRLICTGKIENLSAAANVALCSIDGQNPGVWSIEAEDSAGTIIKRPGLGGDLVFRISAASTGGAYGVGLHPGGNYDAATKTLESGLPALFYGSTSVDAAAASGYIKIAVNAESIMCTGAINGVRLGAAVGEMDGALVGTGYSRSVVLSLYSYGSNVAAQKAVPQAQRIKNNVAAGDKVGYLAVFLQVAPHLMTGATIGASESAVYQLLPIDLWSSPAKAAHYGFMAGVYLVPSTQISTDDYLMCGADRYLVARDMSTAVGTAALAFAVRG